jgi:hypothetical protein
MLSSRFSQIFPRCGWAAMFALAALNLSATAAAAEEVLLRCVYVYDDVSKCDDLTACPPQVGVVALAFDNKTKDLPRPLGVDTPSDKGFIDQIYRIVERSRERIIVGWPNQGAGNRLKFKNPDTDETETHSTSYLCEAHKP